MTVTPALLETGQLMLEAYDLPAMTYLPSPELESYPVCPASMQARVDRARALIRLGKHDDAYPDLQLAEKDSPNEPSIHFLLASVYRSQGKTTEAQHELQTYAQLQREASAAVAGQASGANAIKNDAH